MINLVQPATRAVDKTSYLKFTFFNLESALQGALPEMHCDYFYAGNPPTWWESGKKCM
jgi:hypothetical protein